MQAWRVFTLGEPQETLTRVTLAREELAPTDIRIRVRAAGVGFPDALMIRGEYQSKPHLPFTPGVDVHGEVTEIGAAVTRFTPGDSVIGAARLPHGSFATEAVLSETSAFSTPAGLTAAQAGGFFIAFQTAWFALVHRGALRYGETVLVHAATGGVGSACVQLAKALGARVIAVVGNSSKADAARNLGADDVISRADDDIVARTKELTGGRGANLIIDPVGGPAYTSSTKCIAFEGRIVIVGFASGEIPQAALNHALVKNYSIVGLHLALYRTQSPATIDEGFAALNALVADGRLSPVVTEAVSFEEIPAAIARLESGKTVGRAVALM